MPSTTPRDDQLIEAKAETHMQVNNANTTDGGRKKRLHAHLKLGAIELDLENLLILERRVEVVQTDGRHFLDVLGRGWLLSRGNSG